ncbi:MAG: hypothetical protein R2744_12740 [Bacteroidales bacterium]
MPHTTIDPVVLAARTVLAIQTIVSREINPVSPCCNNGEFYTWWHKTQYHTR